MTPLRPTTRGKACLNVSAPTCMCETGRIIHLTLCTCWHCAVKLWCHGLLLKDAQNALRSRPRSVCVCASLPKERIRLAGELIVLQHPFEAPKALGTVRLLERCLHRCTIAVGRKFDVRLLPSFEMIWKQRGNSAHKCSANADRCVFRVSAVGLRYAPARCCTHCLRTLSTLARQERVS